MKVGVVTGFTGAIGLEITKQLLQRGAFCILPVRNEKKARKCLQDTAKGLQQKVGDLQVRVIPNVNLNSIKSTLEFTAKINKEYESLDFLVNNAGSLLHETRTMTQDGGMEEQFHVNVFTPWLLSSKFRDLIGKSEDGRIANLASNYAGHVNLDDLMFEKRQYDPSAAYQQSKACDRLLTYYCAKQWPDIKVNACHPGVVTSNLLQSLMGQGASGWDSAESAGKTPVFLSLDVNKTGGYFENSQSKGDQYKSKEEDQEKLGKYLEQVLQEYTSK